MSHRKKTKTQFFSRKYSIQYNHSLLHAVRFKTHKANGVPNCNTLSSKKVFPNKGNINLNCKVISQTAMSQGARGK